MPDELPDLSEHNNFLCDVLKKQPELYKSLKDKKTKLGVTLGHCIKTGIDNKGHPMIKTCGLVAGDEECFELFADIFEPVISAAITATRATPCTQLTWTFPSSPTRRSIQLASMS